MLCKKAQIIKIEHIPIKGYSHIAMMLITSIQNANIRMPFVYIFYCQRKTHIQGQFAFYYGLTTFTKRRRRKEHSFHPLYSIKLATAKHISDDQRQLLAGLTYLSFWPISGKKNVKQEKRKQTNILCEPLQNYKTTFF